MLSTICNCHKLSICSHFHFQCLTVTVIEEGENFTDSLSAVILHAVNVIEISNDAEHSTGLVIAEPLSFLFLAIKDKLLQ